jgi:predicted dinucleotide-binding enzyme
MDRIRGALSAAMRIAIIGTGNVGGTLGSRWRQAGHEVTFGGRAPRADGPGGAPVLDIATAVEGAEVVVLALPGSAVADLLALLGGRLAGVVVVDTTNHIGADPVNSRTAVTTSAPDAHYVRAFNTLGWENFAEPLADADLFFAADAEAREVAEQLIAAVGLRPVYVGDGDAAGTVDALLRLWFTLAQLRGNRRIAFRLVE